MATAVVQVVLEATIADGTVTDAAAFESAVNALRSALLSLPAIDAVTLSIGEVRLGP